MAERPATWFDFRCYLPFLLLCWLLAAAAAQQTNALRALPLGQLPADCRLQPIKDLDGYFPFMPPQTAAEWEQRCRQVRRNLAVSLGLWPMPDKTPLKPVIHGKVLLEGYTTEKVYFQSLPGFFVTGNLYRPVGKKGRVPGVLSAHGHWPAGRFLDTKGTTLDRELQSGGESFAEGGRSPLQARCVQLARMGCVVFHYDMIGYADSVQISQSIAHGFAKQRPEMNCATNWGLFSPQAEARLQSVMGLQTWNSIRALDFLAGLPDVDAQRIGVTGASGGGTQTFILCALDPRPAAAFPAVMVSTAMQGGCTCENACLLRIESGNVEIAGLFAPKPLGLTAANDWTKEMSSKGFPQLQQLYSLLGAPSNVRLTPLLQFGHNYNQASRAAMYEWFQHHLATGSTNALPERDYHFATSNELSVWDLQHPKPPGGADFERKLLRGITARDEKLLGASQQSLNAFRRNYGEAFDVILGRNINTAGSVQFKESARRDCGAFTQRVGLLKKLSHAEELPVVLLEPRTRPKQVVVWVSAQGKQGLFASGAERPVAEVETLLKSGACVIGLDLFLQGEFVAEGEPVTRARKVANPREAAAYTFGYNYTLFAQRVHDVLTALKFARTEFGDAIPLHLVGLHGGGHWIAAARAQCGTAVAAAVVDTQGFRFANVADIYDVNFLPGAVKYGDLPALLALGAPGRLWIAGETQPPQILTRIYGKARGAKNLVVAKSTTSSPADAVAWLLQQTRP